MASNPSFKDTKALSFDVYGTLIDWEAAILPSLHPLTSQLPSSHPCHPSSPTYHDSTIAAFSKHEHPMIADNPTVPYHKNLADSYLALAGEWGLEAKSEDAARVAVAVTESKAFPDTIKAMQKLGQRFKLIALSNITNELFAQTSSLKDVKFDAVYTAEDIGSYKPSPKNFNYLLKGLGDDFGLTKSQLVHVAHSAAIDQDPAEKMEINHVWIRRGKDNWEGVHRPEDQRWWETLGDMADEIVQ